MNKKLTKLREIIAQRRSRTQGAFEATETTTLEAVAEAQAVESPIVEETTPEAPIVEESPVVEETPVVEEAPATKEESVVTEEAPTTESTDTPESVQESPKSKEAPEMPKPKKRNRKK